MVLTERSMLLIVTLGLDRRDTCQPAGANCGSVITVQGLLVRAQFNMHPDQTRILMIAASLRTKDKANCFGRLVIMFDLSGTGRRHFTSFSNHQHPTDVHIGLETSPGSVCLERQLDRQDSRDECHCVPQRNDRRLAVAGCGSYRCLSAIRSG